MITLTDESIITVPYVWFKISLARTPEYYAINVLFVASVLTAISLLMFALPVHAEEKVILGVTLLLAYAVLSLLVNDATPQSEHLPFVSKLAT